MLDSQMLSANHTSETTRTNKLAVQSLLRLPVSILSKKQRERIFRGWLPPSDGNEDDDNQRNQNSSYGSTVLDPAVLSLKIKMMQRPVLYEVSFSG